MNMLHTLVAGAVLVGATAFVTAQVTSQQDPGTPANQGDITPEQMERWMEYATPGENHEKLNDMIGTWDYNMKMWMNPASEPQQSTGTVTYEWILDKHYVEGEFQGEFQGQPFHGRELMGYDNNKDEYFTIWIDNMGTGYMAMHGNHEGEDKLVLTGTMDDCMTGRKNVKHRTVTNILGPGKVSVEMYYTDENGKEVKAMELVSTKRN